MNSNVNGLVELGAKWAEWSERANRAVRKRNLAVWRYIESAATFARAKELKSKTKFRKLVRKTNPKLDSRTVSRYAILIRAVVRKKPRSVTARQWVASRGGIGKCK